MAGPATGAGQGAQADQGAQGGQTAQTGLGTQTRQAAQTGLGTEARQAAHAGSARWRRALAKAGHDCLAVLRFHRSGLYSLAVLVGVLSGAGAIAFRLGIDAWSDLLAGGAGERLQIEPVTGVLAGAGHGYLLAAPIVSGAVIGPLMYWLGRSPQGHGVAGVIWSARRSDGTMPGRPALASVVSAALTIGGGGSVGPEGPIAELGASTASVLGHRLHLPRRSVRMLAAAGTAAGIASAFNAPLAGAFFAMEVILLDFTVDAFTFVVLSCVSATVLTHAVLGEAVTMSLPHLDLATEADLGWVAVLGVAGGVVGVGFSRAKYLLSDVATWAFERTHVPAWARPAAGGVLVGALLLIFPQSFGESSLVLDLVLSGGYGVWGALGLALLKVVATALTLGVGFAGGVFAPSLFIGGALGAAFGAVVLPDHPATTAVFGVLGMCAVFTGSGRAPITAVILIIEMTGQYSLLLPLMLVSVLATFISRFLTRTTIYTEELRRRGDDVEDPLASTLIGRTTAGALMSAPPALVRDTDTLARAADVLRASGSTILPVVRVLPQDGAGQAPAPDAGSPARTAQGGMSTPAGRGPAHEVFLGCVSAMQIAAAAVEAGQGQRPGVVAELPLTAERVAVTDSATHVLAVLSRTRADGVPVVRAGGDGSTELAGWIAQQDMVRRLYRHQRAADDAARERTSLGARVQAYLRTRTASRLAGPGRNPRGGHG